MGNYLWALMIISFVGYSVTLYWLGRDAGYRDGQADARDRFMSMERRRERNGW